MCKSPWQELPIYLYKDTLLQLLCARAFSKNSQDLCRMILLGRTYGKDPGQELTGSLCKGFRRRILFRGTCRIPLRGSLERIRRISVHKPSSNSKHLCARFLWRNSPDLNRPPPILGFSLCSCVRNTLDASCRGQPPTRSRKIGQVLLHLHNKSKSRANSQLGL